VPFLEQSGEVDCDVFELLGRCIAETIEIIETIGCFFINCRTVIRTYLKKCLDMNMGL